MPRKKKLARRFEPRGGVSQAMLDAECTYVARELDDHLLCSIADLREKLDQTHRKIALVEDELQSKLSCLPDRERLALRCMLSRDMYHIAMLYVSFFAVSSVADATGTTTLAPGELNPETKEPRPALPFSEWLFGT